MRHDENGVKRRFYMEFLPLWNHVLWGPPSNDSSLLFSFGILMFSINKKPFEM